VNPGASLSCGAGQVRADTTPFVVGQIRGVSSALHGAQRRPTSRPPSTFQTVSSRTQVNKGKERKGRSEMPQPFRHLQTNTIVQDPLVGSQSSFSPSLSLGPSSSGSWPTTL
jgi:hypothetical protein